MTPATLLHLWRDRWHKPLHPDHSVPMVHGRISRWAMDLARSENWGLPGLSAFVLCTAMATMLIAATVGLTTNSQIVLGWALVGFAIYLRRHRGQVFGLALIGMAALLGLRYFVWRIDATLPTHGFGSIALAWGLLMAELALWLRTGLDYFATIWPVEQDHCPLPDDAVTWPTVDIVLIAGNASPATVTSLVANGIRMEWPENKYRVLVIANHDDTEVAAACEAAGITYRVYRECGAVDTGALLNRALYECSAELLLLGDCERALPPDLLRQTIGWFVNEPKLALLQAPSNPLAPAAGRAALAHLHGTQDSPCWAIARRSSVLEIGGFSTQPPTKACHTAGLLEQAGFFDAYLATRPQAGHEPQYTRLDGPFRISSLPLRIWLDQLRSGLHFYAPLTSAVMMLVPLAALLWRMVPIATDLFTLSAYWLPQWILGRLALATALEHQRLRWWDFVKEELGSLAVLLRTSKSFCITWMQQRVKWHRRMPAGPGSRLPAPVPVAFNPRAILGTLLFGATFAYGIVCTYAQATLPLTELYLAWALFWVLSFLAEMAVQHEVDWVQAHQRCSERLSCMLALPETGRMLRATTSNFPHQPLVLTLAQVHAIPVGQSLQLSIFAGQHEFVFPCRVSASGDLNLELQVAREYQADFRQFASFVFARPANWPLWLPLQHADQLLPGWLSRLLLRLQDAFYNLAVKSSAPAVWQKIRAWLFPGNRTHG